MARHVIIIHGWSDSSASFHALAAFLRSNGYDPKVLWLGDYISKDDDVRVSDAAARMAQVIDEMIAAGQLDASFDMIVHSTGGLVARAWLTTRYKGRAETCPCKRLVMLAPANYGSKLAASGKSLLGRVIKGYDNWFESGQSMLNDLELSSPFQWELAQRDIVVAPGGDAATYYGADRVWPFVIVGTHPYPGLLRQIVNEDGGDGTVRVCCANLNAGGVTIDFGKTDPAELITPWASRLACAVPLAVLPTRTHASIIDPLRSEEENRDGIPETPEQFKQHGDLILQALACADFAAYAAIQAGWDAISERTAALAAAPPPPARPEFYHQYMQMNSFVTDDQGVPVEDYFLEFFSDTTPQCDDANTYLHSKVIESVKTNSVDAAYRNLYFDRTDLMTGYYQALPPGVPPTLFMSISAASPGKNINYFRTQQEGAAQSVALHLEDDATKRWLRRNTTHFAQMVIPRRPGDDVFRLTNAAGVLA